MIDKEGATEFIDNVLNRLERSVNEKNDIAISKNRQEFNSLISEYGKVIGRKDTNIYVQNSAEILKKGGYLK